MYSNQTTCIIFKFLSVNQETARIHTHIKFSTCGLCELIGVTIYNNLCQ